LIIIAFGENGAFSTQRDEEVAQRFTEELLSL
jgi:hypothetical protein